MSVIQVSRVSKCFHLHPDRPRSFQELVLSRFSRQGARPAMALWALKDVSFNVASGETVGLIGSNGSGKSTCLKLLTRILDPTSGAVSVRGRVSALLELGAGFHPELTGRENIFLNGSVLGMSRRDMSARFDDIVAFAELERFIDVPVKVYSSGMYVRLAFATAINVSPEILLIDEVLAVGDQSFQDKCLRRIRDLKADGVTIVFVSHDLDSVGSLCDRVVWLDSGKLMMDGPAKRVLDRYLAHVYESEGLEPQTLISPDQDEESGQDGSGQEPADAALEVESTDGPAPPDEVEEPALQAKRWGSGRVRILGVHIVGPGGDDTGRLFTEQGAEVVIDYEAHEPIPHPAFGVAIHRADGEHISGCNTSMSQTDLGPIAGKGTIRYVISQLPLLAGDYVLSVAVHDVAETEAYDYLSFWYPFRVALGGACPHQGLIHIPATWRTDSAQVRDGGVQ